MRLSSAEAAKLNFSSGVHLKGGEQASIQGYEHALHCIVLYPAKMSVEGRPADITRSASCIKASIQIITNVMRRIL